MTSPDTSGDAMNSLGVDEISSILGFLTWKDILRARVCKKWRDAARLTIVPPSRNALDEICWKDVPDYYVRNRGAALALEWLSDALPGMNAINFDFTLGETDNFEIAQGEGFDDPMDEIEIAEVEGVENQDDPMDEHARPIDLSVLSQFHGLQRLFLKEIHLIGRMPFLFHFQHLKTLELVWKPSLQWDLAMLSGLPSLEHLRASFNDSLTGNIQSLRGLRETLVCFDVYDSHEIEGNLHDLADFPKLEKLNLFGTKVTGDIREIGPTDFTVIKNVQLPDGVYGGDVVWQRVEDASVLMYARCVWKKRNPSLFTNSVCCLSNESSDFYPGTNADDSRDPPFTVEIVQAGPRLGWRWRNYHRSSCEVNWFDPEPQTEDEGYDDYLTELESIEKEVNFFRGFSKPPTRDQYQLLIQEAEEQVEDH